MENTTEMESTLHGITVSVVEGDSGGDIEEVPNDTREMERISSNKELLRKAARALSGLELDLACTSEKLVNMNLLMMHVAAREGDFEAFASEKEGTLDSFAVKALEFDALSGIFYSEITEIDKFVQLLQREAKGVSEIISSLDLGEDYITIEEKLLDIEKSIKQSQEQLTELMMQSDKFKRILSKLNGEETFEEKEVAIFESCDSFGTNANFQMETSEQQRQILRELEKSLAQELDLEKKLTECTQALDEMRLRERSLKQQVLSMEEESAAIYARFLEADSASTVLVGISKDLTGQLQSSQLIINSAARRENDLEKKLEKSLARELDLEKKLTECTQVLDEMRHRECSLKQEILSMEEESAALYACFLETDSASTVLMGISKDLMGQLQSSHLIMNNSARRENDLNTRLQNSMQSVERLGKENVDLQELAQRNRLEALTLQEKVNSLEQKLKVSESMLLSQNSSLDGNNEKLKELEEKVVIAEIRAQKAEDECLLLAETNKGLTVEIDHLKGSCLPKEKVESLEKKLKEANVQFQQAMAYVDASQEQQNVVVETLNSKVVEANARADIAEDKLIILSESNEELNQELNCLRNKLECLETSLQLDKETKLTTAKDIDIWTQMITDLIMQLAIERERLHKQMSFLMKDNRALVDKLHIANKVASNFATHVGEKNVDIPSSTCCVDSVDSRKRGNAVSGSSEVENSKPAKEISDEEYKPKLEDVQTNLETVRSIDPGRLNFMYVLFAIVAAVVAVLAACFFFPQN